MIVTLLEKKQATSDIFTFTFRPQKEILYKPGQYIYFTIPKLNYEDSRGNTRHFTLSSSPTEKDIIKLTTQIRPESGYKKTLNELAIGAPLEAEGPQGTFFLDEKDTSQQVLITGGIGITPYRSFIKYASDKKLSIPLTLFYCASTPQELLFKAEFDALSQANSYFKAHYTITHPDDSSDGWDGDIGRINKAFLTKYLSAFSSTTFWVCGPQQMVNDIEELLSELGVPDEQIKTEKFTGY